MNEREAEAQAWLATAGADTVATLAAAPRSTIIPTQLRSTGGARAILDELAANPNELALGNTIGEGGMGIVRAAEQRALGRTVAVKTVKPARRDPSAALDLLREAWVTGSLEHPNIVPVHYLTVAADGTPSIVLKRIEGVEWSGVLRDGAEVARRFSADDLLAWNLGILMQVLNAVRFAHRHGIVHRDLKPSNVMIGDYGEVYLLDWGIAVSLHDDGSGRLPLARHATQLAGTPSYMAPEMLGRDGSPPLSERTDVYLAGAVLYELITGQPPHHGTSPLAVIASVIASRPEFPANAPPELVRICERAMHEEPAGRFESIEALQAAITRYLAHRGSDQLATHARARLAELRAELAGAKRREDLYRLFGACRYGFRDALSAWPENADAKHGLVQAIVALAEFELAAGRPEAAVSLLGELDEPHPLQEAARVAAQTHALRVAQLEQLGREHDHKTGSRTRTVLAVAFGGTFTIAPLVMDRLAIYHEAGHAEHVAWAVACACLVGLAWWWARESLSATTINRRMSAGLAFLFGVQAVIAIGGWLSDVPPLDLMTWNIGLYLAICGMAAITLDPWLWPPAIGYAIGFLVASHDRSLVLMATAAANGLFTLTAAWRWRPDSMRYTDEERARRGLPPRR